MKRLTTTAKLLVSNGSLPKALVALLVFGLMPIPLFFDEIALVIAFAWAWLVYRPVIKQAWESSSRIEA